MRQAAAVGLWILLALLFAAPVLAAQLESALTDPSATPAPPAAPSPSLAPSPNPIDICIDEGPVACFRVLAQRFGVWGIVLFLLVILVVSPLGGLFKDKLQEWYESLLIRRRAPLPAAEMKRREAEYLHMMEQSPALQSSEEKATSLYAYLTRLDDSENPANPARPSEEKIYVPLETGLDIPQRIGLNLSGQEESEDPWWRRIFMRVIGKAQPIQPDKMFNEVSTFKDITEAMEATAETSAGKPGYPALALLGEPGAGKSTLLRKHLRDRVKKALEDPAAQLPIYVYLGEHKTGTTLSFLRREWERMVKYGGLDEALAAGRVWLIADGLNEMPRAAYNLRVAEWGAFLSGIFAANGNRALVTCRSADFGEGIGSPRLVIHKMEEPVILGFLQKRIPDRAARLMRDLKYDRDEGSGKIYELAQVPFWLVMLARLAGRSGLPRNRADLLNKSVDTWLDYESFEHPGGRVLNSDQRQAFKNGLTGLAWEGLSRSQNYTFPRRKARKILRAWQSVVSVDDMLGLGQDCDLLACEGENVRFQHQLLQEFFAARELARRFAKGKNLRRHWRIPWEDWEFVNSRWDPLPAPPQTNWEEALVLAAGMLDEKKAEALSLAILRDNPPLAARCAIESGADLPEEAWERVQAKIKEGLQQDVQRARTRLPARIAAGKMLARMGDPRLLSRQHARPAADGKTTHFIEPEWVEIPAGPFTMGSTWQENLLLRALPSLSPQPDEQPAHTVSTAAYRMAHYPVTVVEYFLFMDAGGYENDAYWQAPGALRWRNAPLPFESSWMARYIQTLRQNKVNYLKWVDAQEKQGSYTPDEAERARRQAEMRDEDLRNQWDYYERQKRNAQGRAARPWGWENSDLAVDNQPVVGVTWYEACAYAAWLEDALLAQKLLPDTMRLRLPTEAEWEKAARGGRQGLWAWGSLWSRDRANTLEGRVMKPTPVGTYPAGASPYGAQDMHGKVWEWCWDWYANDTYKNRAGQEVKDPWGPEDGRLRVLRGGSWGDGRNGARCASRYGFGPVDFSNDRGFRLVCSPSTSDR